MTKRFVSIGECMIEMSGGAGQQYRMGFAGDTLNTAWYMRALLPAEWTVDYVTALGDDLYSKQIRQFLDSNDIGTSHIQTIKNKRPGLYMIHQEAGDRQFTYWRDTSAAKLLADNVGALDAALVGADLVYFSGITLAILAPRARGRLLKAIVKARNAGAQVAFDPNLRPALWTAPRVMTAVLTAGAAISDIVLPTHGDEAKVFGDVGVEGTAQRYLDEGVAEVAVKDGDRPALVATSDEQVTVTPEGGAEVVDTTGAGDSFNGAYLSSRLAGKGLKDSVMAAHAVARIVIGHRGALVDPALVRAQL
ncbi:MAG: sugar kinase [Devosia sp.]|nr:sugar kinase [Devosia sp.]